MGSWQNGGNLVNRAAFNFRAIVSHGFQMPENRRLQGERKTKHVGGLAVLSQFANSLNQIGESVGIRDHTVLGFPNPI